jgi:hypothetical protein
MSFAFTRAVDIERLDSACKGKQSPGHPQLLHGISKTLSAVMLAAVLLQSTTSFLQGNLCLEVSLQIARQQFLDLAGKAQLPEAEHP